MSWKKANTDGAKTEINYAPLRQAKEKKASGPVVATVGRLYGANAACWFVGADATVVQAWKDSIVDKDYEELPGADFSRALEIYGWTSDCKTSADGSLNQQSKYSLI
ncbi:MAG: hypothetical protein JKY56_10615 [Kofleriaceae bacterium]|nr:hypothetical protein [Kofleriaceae bacterium]